MESNWLAAPPPLSMVKNCLRHMEVPNSPVRISGLVSNALDPRKIHKKSNGIFQILKTTIKILHAASVSNFLSLKREHENWVKQFIIQTMNWQFFKVYDVLTNGKLVPNCEHYNRGDIHDEFTRTIIIQICSSNTGKKIFLEHTQWKRN